MGDKKSSAGSLRRHYGKGFLLCCGGQCFYMKQYQGGNVREATPLWLLSFAHLFVHDMPPLLRLGTDTVRKKLRVLRRKCHFYYLFGTVEYSYKAIGDPTSKEATRQLLVYHQKVKELFQVKCKKAVKAFQTEKGQRGEMRAKKTDPFFRHLCP